MRVRLREIETRVLPRGWKDVARQLLLFVGAYVLYQLVRGLVDTGDVFAKASWDATKVINLERTLHVFIEPSIQSWALSKHWLMDIADWTYLNAHYVVTIGALVFIYLRRNDSFYFVRNMFMIAMAIALVGYAVYPTAPPRLMPEWGFTDSIQQFTGFTRRARPDQRAAELLRRHPLDACVLLADDRLADGQAGPAADCPDRLAPVSAVHHLRGHRDGQSLPHGRRARRVHRGRVGAAGQAAAGPGAA